MFIDFIDDRRSTPGAAHHHPALVRKHYTTALGGHATFSKYIYRPIHNKERITWHGATERVRKKKRPNGMKSSAVIKCSGQREDGSAPAPSARWVVCYADKCVALTPGEWPSRHRLKQYLHSFIHGFKSPLQQRKLAATRLSPLGWQWKPDSGLISRFLWQTAWNKRGTGHFR